MDPPSTTHANDIMFIVPQTEHGTVFYVACEGRVIGDELEQRAAVFRTVSLFWEMGDPEWQINGRTSRASYDVEWEEPQWKSSGWNVHAQHGF